MNPIVKNILAVILGFLVGSMVNIGFVMLGPSIIPLPPGIDPMDPESLETNLHLFEAKHFIFPFIAHAMGTLVGAFIAFKAGATSKSKLAIFIGAFFFVGAIINWFMVPFPMWMGAVDLLFAYFPMVFLAIKLAGGDKTIR